MLVAADAIARGIWAVIAGIGTRNSASPDVAGTSMIVAPSVVDGLWNCPVAVASDTGTRSRNKGASPCPDPAIAGTIGRIRMDWLKVSALPLMIGTEKVFGPMRRFGLINCPVPVASGAEARRIITAIAADASPVAMGGTIVVRPEGANACPVAEDKGAGIPITTTEMIPAPPAVAAAGMICTFGIGGDCAADPVACGM